MDRQDAAATAELQRLAASDDTVRRHVAAQSQMDAAMRRIFAEPEVAIALPQAGQGLRTWIPWAAAAALLLAALGGWRMWTISNRPDVLGPLYRQTVAAGFKPDSVCTTDQEFMGWCRSYLRQAMMPTSRPDGVEYVGWSRVTVLSPGTPILLAKVGEDPVLVVMERVDRQTVEPGRIADKQLHAFRRRIGDVVLVEVTPKDHEVILPVIAQTK